MTGQDASLDELLTGTQNLVLVGELSSMSRQQARVRAAELLERFELTDAAGRMVKTYSGGMRRRLDLAASLVTHPPVLFLDEPTTGLDPTSRQRMWEVIRDLVADGTTVLLTTQYLDEADALADRISVIDHGIVIAEGTARELKARIGGDQLEVTLSAPHPAAASTLAALVNGPVVELDGGRRLRAPVERAHRARHRGDPCARRRRRRGRRPRDPPPVARRRVLLPHRSPGERRDGDTDDATTTPTSSRRQWHERDRARHRRSRVTRRDSRRSSDGCATCGRSRGATSST